MVSISEKIVYSILNYAPFAFIALYGYRASLRLSKRVVHLLFLVSVILEVVLFLTGSMLSDPYPMIITQICMIQRLVFYFGAVKAQWGRTVFNLLMVQNIANSTVVMAKSVEGMLFPSMAETPYRWSNSLCLAALLCIGIPLLIRYLDRYFTEDIRDFSGTNLWSYLWVIPLFFWIIWTDRFYYSGQGSLYIALEPKMSIIMSVFIAGQLTIYACIARMVIYHQKTVMLQAEADQLARQSLQYQHILARIKEVTTIRHDMHHSLVLMNTYCEQGQYDKLKQYLTQYSSRFPEGTISYCANSALNVMLVYYQNISREHGIAYEVHVRIPEELPLSEVEVTVLFGNLLENASDACLSLSSQPGRISVIGNVTQNQLVFQVSNPCDTPVRRDEFGNFISSKHEGIGIGTESVRSIIRSHDGMLEFLPGGGQFQVRFTIPMEANKKLSAGQ